MSQSRKYNPEQVKQKLLKLQGILAKITSIDRFFLKGILPNDSVKLMMRQKLNFFSKLTEVTAARLKINATHGAATHNEFHDGCHFELVANSAKMATAMLYNLGENEELSSYAQVWLHSELRGEAEIGRLTFHAHPQEKYTKTGELATIFNHSIFIIGPDVEKKLDKHHTIPALEKETQALGEDYYAFDVLLGKLMSPKEFKPSQYADMAVQINKTLHINFNYKFNAIPYEIISRVKTDCGTLLSLLAKSADTNVISLLVDILKITTPDDTESYRTSVQKLANASNEIYFEMLRKMGQLNYYPSEEQYKTLEELLKHFSADIRSMDSKSFVNYNNNTVAMLDKLIKISEHYSNLEKQKLLASDQLKNASVTSQPIEIKQSNTLIIETKKPSDRKAAKTPPPKTENQTTPSQNKVLIAKVTQQVKVCKKILTAIFKMKEKHPEFFTEAQAKTNIELKKHFSEDFRSMDDTALKVYAENHDDIQKSLEELQRLIQERVALERAKQAKKSRESKQDTTQTTPSPTNLSTDTLPSPGLLKRLETNENILKLAIADIKRHHQEYVTAYDNYREYCEQQQLPISPELASIHKKEQAELKPISLPSYAAAELSQSEAATRRILREINTKTTEANNTSREIDKYRDEIKQMQAKIKTKKPTTQVVLKELSANQPIKTTKSDKTVLKHTSSSKKIKPQEKSSAASNQTSQTNKQEASTSLSPRILKLDILSDPQPLTKTKLNPELEHKSSSLNLNPSEETSVNSNQLSQTNDNTTQNFKHYSLFDPHPLSTIELHTKTSSSLFKLL